MTIPAITPLQQHKQRTTESWNHLYQEAVTDFPINSDFYRYVQEVQLWMTTVNNQLDYLMKQLSTHTHNVPVPGGVSVSTPPINSYTIRWSGQQYIIPKYVNTSGKEPNIPGTPNFTPRKIVPYTPSVNYFVSPATLLQGI